MIYDQENKENPKWTRPARVDFLQYSPLTFNFSSTWMTRNSHAWLGKGVPSFIRYMQNWCGNGAQRLDIIFYEANPDLQKRLQWNKNFKFSKFFQDWHQFSVLFYLKFVFLLI